MGTFITRRRGFTLIELLVVIAIIGILSAVVLASLGTAREQANDARIKSELRSVQTQSHVFYSKNGSYDPGSGGGICEDEIVVDTLEKIYPGYDPNDTTQQGDIQCNDDPEEWALSVPFNSSDNFWCVDYSGKAIETTQTLDDNGSGDDRCDDLPTP